MEMSEKISIMKIRRKIRGRYELFRGKDLIQDMVVSD